jgi:integrase
MCGLQAGHGYFRGLAYVIYSPQRRKNPRHMRSEEITKRVYPHLLRRSVATTLLEWGMPIEQIQKFLGHSKLETTQVYAESNTEMLRESHQRARSRWDYLLHTSARVTCMRQWVVSYPPRCSTSSLRVAA